MIDSIIELAEAIAVHLQKLGFSRSFYPQDLPHLHYENGVFQKIEFKELFEL